jgi:hypothetical protein
MCDIKGLSKERDELSNQIEEVSTLSGATILRVDKEIEDVEIRAQKNIQSLFFLL